MREMHVGRGTGWDNRGRGKRREGTRRTQLGTAWRGLNVAEAMVRENALREKVSNRNKPLVERDADGRQSASPMAGCRVRGAWR